MNTTFPLSGKTFCLHSTKSKSQRETLPGKRENISPYEQNEIFDLSKCFLGNRDNFCPYEQALSLRCAATPVRRKVNRSATRVGTFEVCVAAHVALRMCIMQVLASQLPFLANRDA